MAVAALLLHERDGLTRPVRIAADVPAAPMEYPGATGAEPRVYPLQMAIVPSHGSCHRRRLPVDTSSFLTQRAETHLGVRPPTWRETMNACGKRLYEVTSALSASLVASWLALVAHPSAGHADKGVELGGFGIAHIFNDDSGLGDPANLGAPDDSLLFGLRLAYGFSSRVDAEGEIAVMPAETRGTQIDTRVLSPRVHALYHFRDGALQPFALLGGGFMYASPSVGNSDLDLALHGGVGAKYSFAGRWGVRADARLVLPEALGGGLTSDWELMAGLFRRFGTASPGPRLAAQRPASSSSEGEKATFDQHRTAKTETSHGVDDRTHAADGPDEGAGQDLGQDAVARRKTPCPGGSGGTGESEDDDCDDRGDERHDEGAESASLIRIQFDPGSAVIRPSERAVLDQAAELLVTSDVRVEIEGHADNVGGPATNQRLARERAAAVRAYLVARGVDTSRLEVLGYGADRPIADNESPEGRAQNRRVEFRISDSGAEPQ